MSCVQELLFFVQTQRNLPSRAVPLIVGPKFWLKDEPALRCSWARIWQSCKANTGTGRIDAGLIVFFFFLWHAPSCTYFPLCSFYHWSPVDCQHLTYGTGIVHHPPLISSLQKGCVNHCCCLLYSACAVDMDDPTHRCPDDMEKSG